MNASGTLKGVVQNKEDKQPLAGANVTVEGTVLGGVTDGQGKFIIRNIPSGRYSLTVSMIGYARKRIESIQILQDTLIELSVELEPLAIQTDPVVVSASKREQSLQEIPVSVSVVGREQLSFRNTVTVDDALRYVPGVNMTSGQVNIRGSSGYSLGVGTRVLLMIDGLPFLSGDTQEIIWESLPISQIERIEVVKGASSALYGSSALGGVINVLTKSAIEEPTTKVRTYGGFYQQPKYSQWQWANESRFFSGAYLSHERKIGNTNIVLYGSRTLNDGYKRNDYWKRWNWGARINYDISPFQSAGLSFGILDQKRGNFLFWKDFQHALEPPEGQRTQRVESLRWNLSGNYKHFVSNDFFFTVKSSWFHSDWLNNIPVYIPGTPPYFDPNGSHSIADAFNLELQVIHQISKKHTLTFGMYEALNKVVADTIFGSHRGQNAAVYVQDEFSVVEGLRFSSGGRYDVYSLEGAKTVDQFNPKFGITYSPTEATTFRFSLGRGFRAPTVAEVYTTTEASGVIIVPNPNLIEERSWSYEIGLTNMLNENLYTEISFFRNEFWNLIEPTFRSDGKVHFDNITRARIQGFEALLNLSLWDKKLFSQVGYTYLYPEDLNKRDILKYRPRHLLYLSEILTLPPYQFGIDFRFISKVDRIDEEFVTLGIIPQGDERVPIYVTDVRAGVDWSLGNVSMKTLLQVNNVFQYYYVELIGNVAPLRNYVLTLEATL